MSRLALGGVSERPGRRGCGSARPCATPTLAGEPIIRERYPVLSRALLAGASPQLRNLATTGGNLLQRTRCVYFQDVTTPCNKREPGTGCSALTGISRSHAVLGTSESCVAVHPSDMAVALVALDAVVHTASPDGGREIPIDRVSSPCLPTSRSGTRSCEHGELITAITLPELPLARALDLPQGPRALLLRIRAGVGRAGRLAARRRRR